MPKLKRERVIVSNETREYYDISFDVHVDSYGEFYANFPVDHELIPSLRAVKDGRARVGQIRNKAPIRVGADNLKSVVALIETAAKDFISVETTVERVIRYSVSAEASLFVNTDGSMHANGTLAEADRKAKGLEQAGEWVMTERLGGRITLGGYGATMPHNHIGLIAEVKDKVTHRRGEREQVEYKSPTWEFSHHEFKNWGSMLNAVSTQRRFPDRDFKEMPYTEEAARFFYDASMSIAMLAINVLNFFNDTEKLESAIKLADQGNGKILLTQIHGED